MTAKRVYFAMIAGIVLLVALCGAATFFAHKLILAEGSKLMEQKLENGVLEKQITALAQAKEDIKKYEDLETIARTVVPQEKNQASTILEVLNLAKESGITLTSITFPESQLGELQKLKAAPATNEQAADDANKQPQSAPAKMVDSNTTQLTPLKDLKGVYSMEIKIQSDANKPISYQQLLTYLEKLENNRRTAQVKDISIQPDSDNRNQLSFSLTLNSYVKP